MSSFDGAFAGSVNGLCIGGLVDSFVDRYDMAHSLTSVMMLELKH